MSTPSSSPTGVLPGDTPVWNLSREDLGRLLVLAARTAVRDGQIADRQDVMRITRVLLPIIPPDAQAQVLHVVMADAAFDGTTLMLATRQQTHRDQALWGEGG